MKKFIFSVLAVFFINSTAQSQTQKYALWNDAVFLSLNGDTLYNTIAGGINQGQFSKVDLNNDGVKDLVVFDRTGHRFTTFINKGSVGRVRYVYDPRFEQAFPQVKDWALLADVNNDGKEDLFHYGGNVNVGMYLNVTKASDTMVRFEKRRFIGNDMESSDFLQAFTFSSRPWADTSEVICDFSNLPALADVDGDGDLDFLTLLNGGVGISLYKNVSKETGRSLDDPFFHDIDWCWGDFEEGVLTNDFNLKRPQWCGRKIYKKHAGGSTLLLFDQDADGDMDLVIGNAGYDNLTQLINGRKQFATKQDTMISYDLLFPSYDVPAANAIFPSAFYLDVDNDNVRDLIVSVNAISKLDFVFGETNHLLYYKNTGTDNRPVFDRIQSDFLIDHMLDFGGWAAPAFADIDGDGDMDLFIGHNGNYLTTLDTADRIAFLENTGTRNQAVFVLRTLDFAGISSRGIKKMAPHFADLDGDGDLDLLMGNTNGRLVHFRNDGTSSAPNLVWVSDAYQGIDVGENSTISVADINNDQLHDLIIGEKDGNINYYRNVGTASTPRYVLQSDTFGGVKLNEYILQTFIHPITFEAYDSLVLDNQGYSVPCVVDLNGDGNLELIGGAVQGTLRLFTGISVNPDGKFAEQNGFVYDFKEANYAYYDFGNYSFPAAADLNGDGVMEIVVGNSRGGISMLSTNGLVGSVSSKMKNHFSLQVFPNPTSQICSVIAPDGNYTYSLIDLQGKVILEGKWQIFGQAAMLNLLELSDGVYFLQLQHEDGRSASQKVVKISN